MSRNLPESNIKRTVTLAVSLGVYACGAVLNFESGAEDVKPSLASFVLPAGRLPTFSHKNRRLARALVRTRKRRKLAVRLLRLIISELCKQKQTSEVLSLDAGIDEALRGLLRNRGFSFELPSDILVSIPQEDFQMLRETADWQALLPDDPQRAAELLDQDVRLVLRLNSILLAEEDLEKRLSAFVGLDGSVKRLTAVYRNFALSVARYADALEAGRHSRKAYLNALPDRISSDSRLAQVADLVGGSRRLAKLVGNVSNLPLKTLRQYFNSPDMAAGDRWDYERFRHAIIAGVMRQRPTNDAEKHVRRSVLEHLSSSDILEALETLDPEMTIPPYESGINRNPPADMTLWLSTISLDKQYGEHWRDWAICFETAEPILGDELDRILSYPSRKRTEMTDIGSVRAAAVLQRVLDRARASDPYRIEALISDRMDDTASTGQAALTACLGSADEVLAFLNLARRYNDERKSAERGLRLPLDESLLEVAGIHPPLKKHVLPLLIGDVFGLDDRFGRQFLRTAVKLSAGDKTVSEVLENAAAFAREEQRSRFLSGQSDGTQTVKLFVKKTALEKQLESVQSVLAENASLQRVGMTPSNLRVLRSLATAARLGSLLSEDREGFLSTSVAAFLENLWRTRREAADVPAQCRRLPADPKPMRDRIFERLLKREAYETARFVVEEWRRCGLGSDNDVDFLLVLTERSSRIAADLERLKESPSAKSASREAASDERALIRRAERLEKAGSGISPATGKPISSVRLRRILTGSLPERALHHDINLLPLDVGDPPPSSLKLKELHPNYLKAVFKKDNFEEVEKLIEQRVSALVNTDRSLIRGFKNATEENACRHALLLDSNSSARLAVLRALADATAIKTGFASSRFARFFFDALNRLSDRSFRLSAPA